MTLYCHEELSVGSQLVKRYIVRVQKATDLFYCTTQRTKNSDAAAPGAWVEDLAPAKTLINQEKPDSCHISLPEMENMILDTKRVWELGGWAHKDGDLRRVARFFHCRRYIKVLYLHETWRLSQQTDTVLYMSAYSVVQMENSRINIYKAANICSIKKDLLLQIGLIELKKTCSLNAI